MKSLYKIIALLTIFSCEDKAQKDKEPPTVTITAPTFGSKLNEVVTVTCVSKDNKGVQMVELWIDGQSSGLSDETEPYAFDLNTTTYEDGEHTLIVRSYDVNDNQADSAPITVIIDNTISKPNSIEISNAEYSNAGFTVNWKRSNDGRRLYAKKANVSTEVFPSAPVRCTQKHRILHVQKVTERHTHLINL